MYKSRKLDEKQLILLKQGKGFFHIGASGHEAVQVAASKCFKTEKDYSYPYYRNQAYCLGLGMTSREILLSFLAKDSDPNSGGVPDISMGIRRFFIRPRYLVLAVNSWPM